MPFFFDAVCGFKHLPVWRHRGILVSPFEQDHFGLASLLMDMNQVVLEHLCEEIICHIPRIYLAVLPHPPKMMGKNSRNRAMIFLFISYCVAYRRLVLLLLKSVEESWLMHCFLGWLIVVDFFTEIDDSQTFFNVKLFRRSFILSFASFLFSYFIL